MVCCLGQYDLAFLHMLLHGFFKALLFLGRGVTIHNNTTNSQSIIKTNLLVKRSTFLHVVFTLGVLGLIGCPFIGSFHSKHLILNVTQFDNILLLPILDKSPPLSYRRALAYIGLYFSPILTLRYSIKLLYFIYQKPSIVISSSSYIMGFASDMKVVLPISMLATFRFIVGLLISQRERKSISIIESFEDIYYSTFLFVLFLGLILHALLLQNSARFLYNISGSHVISTMLFVRSFLTASSFQLLEYILLKKGLKLVIPTNNTDIGHKIRINIVPNLEIPLSVTLFNLVATLLILLVLFSILF